MRRLLFGVDVSHHQGEVDWNAVAQDGIRFAIIKASEGTGTTDPVFARNWRAAVAADLVPGAYHFLHPGDGAAQARHFLDVVGDARGGLVVVDVEATASGGHATVADAAEFVGQVRRRLGSSRSVGLYTGWWYWNGILGDPDLTALGVWLWESRYVKGGGPYRDLAGRVDRGWFGQTRAGGLTPSVIQFTSDGEVAGVAGRADVDLFTGDLAALRALA